MTSLEKSSNAEKEKFFLDCEEDSTCQSLSPCSSTNKASPEKIVPEEKYLALEIRNNSNACFSSSSKSIDISSTVQMSPCENYDIGKMHKNLNSSRSPSPVNSEVVQMSPCENDDSGKNLNSSRPPSPVNSEVASSADVSSIVSFPEYDLNPNMKISELKQKITDVIKRKGPNLIEACRNFDRRKTNKIPKSQLRLVLRTFCLPLTAAQFNILCNDIEMNSTGKVNYFDFLTKLSDGNSIPFEGNCEKISDYLPVDEVELRIKQKIKEKLFDVVRAFWLFDVNKDGLVQKVELRRIIKNYCFDLSDAAFNGLWKMHDPKNKCVISYKDFLIKLGINADRYQKYVPLQSVANAMCWTDRKSKTNLDDCSNEQISRRAALESRDDPAIQGLPMEEILMILRERIERKQNLLNRVFNLFGCEKSGLISLGHLHLIINFFTIAISPTLFNQILERLKISPSADCKIDYQSFLKVMKVTAKDTSLVKKNKKKLDCHPIVQRIKNHVLNPCARLQSVFTKKTEDGKWQITRQELRKAIEMGLNFHLSNEEYKELASILDPWNTNIIDCHAFLKLFEGPCDTVCSGDSEVLMKDNCTRKNKYKNLNGKGLKSRVRHHLTKNIKNIEQETKKWVAMVQKIAHFKSRCDPQLPMDEVEEMLRECVQARKTAMLRDFRTLDACRVGVVCKDDTKNILDKYSFRFNDKQFEELWKKFPLNKYHQLLYDQFLDIYSALPASENNKTPSEQQEAVKLPDNCKGLRFDVKVKSMSSDDPKQLRKDNSNLSVASVTSNRSAEKKCNKGKEALYAKSPHLKLIFEPMESVIVRNFRAIRFNLRSADKKRSGTVHFHTLRRVLAKNGIHLDQEDEFHILEHFDTQLSGQVDYRQFLRHFVWYA